MNSQPYSFTTGYTDPVGDCGKFEAGITVGEWLQRIVVYGSTPADAEALRDQLMTDSLYLRGALEHIQKTVGQSRTQTRRLRWIAKRAELALAGRPYVASEHELPPDGNSEHFKLLRQKSVLKERTDRLEALLRGAETVIGQFMPNVGKCFGIDFALLNETLVGIRSELKPVEGGGDVD